MKKAVTRKRAQIDLLHFIGKDTVLIGHALHNDLRCLKFIHEKIVDTSVLYPHMYGYPYKRRLKNIAKEILDIEIQQGDSHSSYEDACVATHLAIRGYQMLKNRKENQQKPMEYRMLK